MGAKNILPDLLAGLSAGDTFCSLSHIYATAGGRTWLPLNSNEKFHSET